MVLDGSDTTHFGYQTVDSIEKNNLVSDVFASVVDKYDLMNDVMSFGLHRFWKKFSIDCCNISKNASVLDVAVGTGDLAKHIAGNLSDGKLHVCDLQFDMLTKGRDKLLDMGIYKNIFYAQCDAENLSYQSEMFDVVTIGFGLRNVTNVSNALREFYRVLKPGGKLMILEFSKIDKNLELIYDWYSFNIIPKLGSMVAKDSDSYQYLVESIRMHPNQQELAKLVVDAGFASCIFDNFTAGIVSMHIAYK